MNLDYEQKFTPHKIQTPNEWNGLYFAFEIEWFSFSSKRPKKIELILIMF